MKLKRSQQNDYKTEKKSRKRKASFNTDNDREFHMNAKKPKLIKYATQQHHQVTAIKTKIPHSKSMTTFIIPKIPHLSSESGTSPETTNRKKFVSSPLSPSFFGPISALSLSPKQHSKHAKKVNNPCNRAKKKIQSKLVRSKNNSKTLILSFIDKKQKKQNKNNTNHNRKRKFHEIVNEETDEDDDLYQPNPRINKIKKPNFTSIVPEKKNEKNTNKPLIKYKTKSKKIEKKVNKKKKIDEDWTSQELLEQALSQQSEVYCELGEQIFQTDEIVSQPVKLSEIFTGQSFVRIHKEIRPIDSRRETGEWINALLGQSAI